MMQSGVRNTPLDKRIIHSLITDYKPALHQGNAAAPLYINLVSEKIIKWEQAHHHNKLKTCPYVCQINYVSKTGSIISPLIHVVLSKQQTRNRH
jgi:hypothetical protein